MADTTNEDQGARYFGETSPDDMRQLERNAARATSEQMAIAASYLQTAFKGQYYAWFGGWALRLRGSNRETRDLDLIVLAKDIRSVRNTLRPYSWRVQCPKTNLTLADYLTGPCCHFMSRTAAFRSGCS